MITYSLKFWWNELIFSSFPDTKQFYEENKELLDYRFDRELYTRIRSKIISNHHRWLNMYNPDFYGRETKINEMTFDEFDKEVSDRYNENAGEKQILEQHLRYFYPLPNTDQWRRTKKIDFNKKVKFNYNRNSMEYIFKYLWYEEIPIISQSSYKPEKFIRDDYTVHKNWSVEIKNKELYQKVFDLVYEYTISRVTDSREEERYIKKV